MDTMESIISKNRAWYCLECGKCSAVCPITRWETREYTSPRLLVEKAIEGRTADVLDDLLFWSCLTCKRCSELCPSDVLFSEFVRDMRQVARDLARSGDCTHGDAIQTWVRLMTHADMHQNRLGWLTPDLKVSDTSDTLFFVGCLPYYDTLFQGLAIEGVRIAQAAVKLLNHLGIEPQILADERCCGHDQLWQGDVQTFRALAEQNLAQIQASGAKRIVTTCPECARTLKVDYPQFFGAHGLEVMHLTELLAPYAADGRLKLTDALAGRAVTYQDPCRLGRHLGVYEAPRQLIADLGLHLVEMERTRKTSLCCGTSCWTECGQVSKAIQSERLHEAQGTGADLLVTACVKCQIHFKCAQEDPRLAQEAPIEIRDLTTLLAEAL